MEEVVETLARLEPPLSYVSIDTTTNLLIHGRFRDHHWQCRICDSHLFFVMDPH